MSELEKLKEDLEVIQYHSRLATEAAEKAIKYAEAMAHSKLQLIKEITEYEQHTDKK